MKQCDFVWSFAELFIARNANGGSGAAVRAGTEGHVGGEFPMASGTPLHAFSKIDVQSEAFQGCIFHKSFKTKGERVGIDTGEFSDANTHFQEARPAASQRFLSRAAQDGFRDPQLMHGKPFGCLCVLLGQCQLYPLGCSR